MNHDLTQSNSAHDQPSWYCERCRHMVDTAQALQQPWGSSVAVVCPTCRTRLGEVRYQGHGQAGNQRGATEQG
jgi:hypothetical protein